MKRAKEFMIALLVSPEILVVVIFLLIYEFIPKLFIFIGAVIRENEPVKFLALTPVSMLGLMIHGRKELLFPEHEKTEFLLAWEGYYLILDRYWISIVFCGVCVIASVAVWSAGAALGEPDIAAIFLCAIIVSLVTYITFHNATIRLRRELAKIKHMDDNK